MDHKIKHIRMSNYEFFSRSSFNREKKDIVIYKSIDILIVIAI